MAWLLRQRRKALKCWHTPRVHLLPPCRMNPASCTACSGILKSTHTPMGQQLIETFLHKCAGLSNNWDASSIIEDQVAKIREKVGDAQVICGLSGGVDSAVAAALVHKAIGDQLTCVFVDHGLLRKGEAEQVKHDSSRRPASSSSPWTPPKTSSLP